MAVRTSDLRKEDQFVYCIQLIGTESFWSSKSYVKEYNDFYWTQSFIVYFTRANLMSTPYLII